MLAEGRLAARDGMPLCKGSALPPAERDIAGTTARLQAGINRS